jgi:Family of unknown function (DUF5681)
MSRTSDVGYGKPPQATRFKKGVSGNPKGRPKGSLNIATVFTKTLRERVVINEHGQRKTGEPLPVLEHLKRTLGEYNFAGQYQQSPAPLGGGMVKWEWFNGYVPGEQPAKFDMIFQSWDTANKSSELSDFSVCTT